MTFEEYLKSKGLTEEQIADIVGGMKENKLYLSAEENIDERYGKLKGQHDEASGKLTAAEELIKQLQPQAKGNEELQGKIADYEQQVKDAEERAAKAERDASAKVALLANGALPEDVDYLMYRIEQGDAEVKIGEDGKLSGMDEAVKSLKTACPKNFSTGGDAGDKVEDKPLPKGDGDHKTEPQSLEDALRQAYEPNKE
ncbi:phage scaffolding protein [Gordonibacter sp.]|uniref:phage scaffolding protein n=1 Tax=Gordonibacter sp. TaxID=1968902 RepID=UPI002FC70B21